jgi:hypothetical protein
MTSTLHRLVAAAALTFVAATLTAQVSTITKPTPPQQGVVPLAPDPLRVEAVGVTMHMPLGSVAENAVYEKIATVRIQLPENLGLVVIQERRTTNLDLGITHVADEIITQLLALAPRVGFITDPDDPTVGRDKDGNREPQVVGTRGGVVSRNKNFQVGGYAADHSYVEIPREGTNDMTVRGTTLIKTGPGRFVLFELFTSLQPAKRASEMYEVMLGSVVIEDPTDIASRRAASLAAGIRALARLEDSDYREIFDAHGERWERLYTAAGTGLTLDDEEIGYRRVKTRVGHRGDLTPKKPREKWTANDLQEGYIVQIDARLLDLGGVIDSRSTYFLSADRREESWVVNMAIRREDGTSRWQEIGARSDTDLTVQIIPQSSAATTIRPQIDGEGYISVVEALVLPQLLARVAIPADYAFYTYQTTSGTIRLRTDSLNEAPQTAGGWTILTKLNADAELQTTRVNNDGKILSTNFQDGRRWDPIELDRLLQLWKSKGLPLD